MRNFLVTFAVLAYLATALTGGPAPAADVGDTPGDQRPRIFFNTLFVTRHGLGSERFEQFLRQARPQIVQAGHYGPQLHGYGDSPGATGYPMNLPVSGVSELLEVYRRVNALCASLDLRVVGHFPLGKALGSWDRQDGFVDFYLNRWDESLLGPRPHDDIRQLLALDASGDPIQEARYQRYSYVGLCMSSPYTRQMVKQTLRVALETGLDGVMVNFNYRWGCVCEHCQRLFREHLRSRFTERELAEAFGIEDIETYVFERIDARMPAFPAEDATALDIEAMRWGALQFKEAFDEIFLDYGRSLNPNLIVATWNHIGNVGVREERSFLPAELWGRGEDYFWYSGIHQGTDLANRRSGDGWLLSAYIQELGGGRPHVIGKYERIRLRAAIAEGVATGGGGMGRYQTSYRDEDGFPILRDYYQWLNANRDLYWPRESAAEVALVLPRQAALAGQRDAFDAFRTIGQALVEHQVLLDVVADEKMTLPRLQRYRMVIVPRAAEMTGEQRQMLADYQSGGGMLIQPSGGGEIQAEHVVAAVADHGGLTHIDAPFTLRAALWRQPGRLILHLVNYNRDEQGGERAANRAPAHERPIVQEDVGVRLALRPGMQVRSVRLISPDGGQPEVLPFSTSRDRLAVLTFTVPRVLVYGVVVIELE